MRLLKSLPPSQHDNFSQDVVNKFNTVGQQGWNFFLDMLFSDKFTKTVEIAKQKQLEHQEMAKKYLKTVRNQVKKEIVFDEDALYSKIKTDDNFQEVN